MEGFRLKNLFGKAAAGIAAAGIAAAAIVFAPSAGAVTPPETDIREPHTANSRALQSFADRFNAEDPDVTLIVVDRDWFQLNAALQDASPVHLSTTMRLAEKYVQEKAGVKLAPEEYRKIAEYVRAENINSLPLRVTEKDETGKEVSRNVCFVFPYSVDQNAEEQLRQYVLNLSPEIHGPYARLPLNPKIRPLLQREYGNIHEVTHCYDIFTAQGMRINDRTIGSVPEFMLLRHKSEMAADVNPSLYMAARYGITDAASERADLRLVGTAMGGPLSYRVPGLYSATGGQFSGFIYSVSSGLSAAQKEIDRRAEKLKNMSFREILDVAQRVTVAHSLGENEALGSLFLWDSRYDQNKLDDMSAWRLVARQAGVIDYQKSYQYATGLQRDMNRALFRVFNFESEETPPGTDPLSIIPFAVEGKMMNPFESVSFSVECVQGIKEYLRHRSLINGGGTEGLVRAYEDYKDRLRGDIEHGGTAETKFDAREKLLAINEALRQALREDKYGRPPSQEELERRVREQQQQQQAAPAFNDPAFVPSPAS